MRKALTILIILITFFSCGNSKQEDNKPVDSINYIEIIEEEYEISKANKGGNTTLVLFGGFPENASDIKREFDFLEVAKKKQIAILYMNYNRKLWMTEMEKKELSERINSIFSSNELPIEKIYFGGFSSGGNISLLLTNYLVSTKSKIQPKGVFVVDSPVDLLELYRLSERNIARNFSESSVQEANWLIGLFNEEFGLPENGIDKYEEHSPFTSETNNINNLSSLNELKIRFYSEPDTLWWKENRNNDPTDLNAYWIEKLATELKQKFLNSKVEYISTKNKGVRANGERHPHSWSIIDKEELLIWIETK